METNLHHISILCFLAISRNLDRIVASAFGCGFNRSMQHIEQIVQPVFRSLTFLLVSRSRNIPVVGQFSGVES